MGEKVDMKEKAEAVTAGGARTEESERTVAETVNVRFTVTWKGDAEATLEYLIDGGVVVLLDGKQATGKGRIVVAYTANNTGVHKIEWGLTFPKKKLGGLKATASVGSGDAQVLKDMKDDSAEHKWVDQGRAVG